MQYSRPKTIRADPSPDMVPRLLDAIGHPVAKNPQDPEAEWAKALYQLAPSDSETGCMDRSYRHQCLLIRQLENTEQTSGDEVARFCSFDEAHTVSAKILACSSSYRKVLWSIENRQS